MAVIIIAQEVIFNPRRGWMVIIDITTERSVYIRTGQAERVALNLRE